MTGRNFTHEEMLGAFEDMLNYYPGASGIFVTPEYYDVFVLDLDKVMSYNERLVEDIVNYPDDALRALREAINDEADRNLDLPIVIEGYYPLDRKRTVFSDDGIKIDEGDINTIVVFEGQLITMAKEKRPRIKTAAWECSDCGGVTYVMQDLGQGKIQQPVTCSYCGKPCGRVNFKLLLEKSEIEEVITFKIRELASDTFTTIRCQLTNSRRINRYNLRIGELYQVIGILRYHTSGRKNDGYYYLDVHGIKPLGQEDIELSAEDERRIKEFSENPELIEVLKSYIAPDIRGLDEIKESLLLQLVGGVDNYTRDGVLVSGNIHILLIGDPGTAKTQLMQSIARVAPKAVMAIGTSSSTVGLTVSAVKDEYTGEWEYIAGVFPRANGGLAIVDELDSFIKKEGDGAFLQALESQEITKAVAGGYITMAAHISFLGGANPKYGKFTPEDDLLAQVDMPPRLFSRMDMIWAILDEVNETRDENIARALLKLKDEPDELDIEFFKKYIAYARHLKPEMTEDAVNILTKYYVSIRKKDFYTTARQARSLKKLAVAYAKLRLSEKVEAQDAERAISLYNKYLASWNFDAGQINAGALGRELEVKKIIYLYLMRVEDAPGVEIIQEVMERLGENEPFIREVLGKMVAAGAIRRHGDIYYISRRDKE